jgi:hypothetical protein
VSLKCYWELVRMDDAVIFNEVLLARKVSGSIPEGDRGLINRAVRVTECHPNAKKVLAEHSIVVDQGMWEDCASSESSDED